jgi:hypothetical protein
MPVIGEDLVIPFTIGGPEPSAEGPVFATNRTITNPFSYYAYDFKTGELTGQLPLRTVKFGEQLNAAGNVKGFLDLTDPRVLETQPVASTVPNKSYVAVDFNGAVVGGGVVLPREWNVEGSPSASTRTFEVQCSGAWAYFASRVQATDYSAPPSSGIEPGGMTYWKATPWDASLIACQIIHDALSVPYGNPLGGLGLLLNGVTPSGAKPAAPEADYIAISYPYTSMQVVDTLVTQLSQLGLGVGFDYGLDIAYSKGPGSPLIGTMNVSYPRRGRTVAENHLTVDLTTARGYSFPEDGTQTANQVYEVGGSGAIEVSQNVNPLDQGYLLWERVISRAQAQSQHILELLKQTGTSDLATYSYAPVTPTIKLSVEDPNLPLGSFIVGDDIHVSMPVLAPDGGPFDERFLTGLEQEWRITAFDVEVKDEGDAIMTLALAQPPYLEALAPAV